MPTEPMSAERIAEFEMRLTVKPLFNQTRPYAEVAEFIAEVKRLQAVEVELRKDVARLDWLDKNPRHIAHSTGYRKSHSSWYWRDRDLVTTDAIDLRAAIDAAMLEMGKGGVK